MSLYGLSRLLGSRDLGPSQIVPTLDAFALEVEARCDTMARQVEQAGEGLDGPLAAAHALVGEECWRVAEGLVAGFSGEATSDSGSHPAPGKFGAKRRLKLERITPALGSELQSVRQLVEQLAVASQPQPMTMRLGEVLHGNWRKRPAFGGERHTLLLAAGGPEFVTEPRFLRASVERAVRSLGTAGDDPSLLLLARRRGADIEIVVGSTDSASETTVDRASLLVGPSTPNDGPVLQLLAQCFGTSVVCGDASMRISFAA